jgi:hypothetical protein
VDGVQLRVGHVCASVWTAQGTGGTAGVRGADLRSRRHRCGAARRRKPPVRMGAVASTGWHATDEPADCLGVSYGVAMYTLALRPRRGSRLSSPRWGRWPGRSESFSTTRSWRS